MEMFINSNISRDSVENIKSTHISTYLQNNNIQELKKIHDFYSSEQSILLLTGFGGTGKRLLIEHSFGFLAPNVLHLYYDCKIATVCDDILLNFIDTLQKSPNIQKIPQAKIENFNRTLNRYIGLCNAPILVFINSFDNIQEKNKKLILDFLLSILQFPQIKVIITAKKFDSEVIPENIDFSKILSKPFNKNIFTEYIQSKNLEATEEEIGELYRLSRGYYYYTKLATSVIENTKSSLGDFLSKAKNSGKIFDKYLCDVAISTLPIPIRNFFWFLLLLRHGISYDALSVLDLYDEISIKFLLKNGYIYETAGTIFVCNYFHTDVEILIPLKIKQKLHKYLIEIYQSQLQEKPENRVIKLSRQSLNAEIEYHQIKSQQDDESVNIIENTTKTINPIISTLSPIKEEKANTKSEEELIAEASNLINNHKHTEAIEIYNLLLDKTTLNRKKIDIFIMLAKVFAKISDWSKAIHYYTLAYDFFTNNNENINANYIKLELAEVYYNTYNNHKARQLLKEIIFSQDSPQGLMLEACLKLGNLEDSLSNFEEAFNYYKQGVESIDETSSPETTEELYFKYAVALDEQNKKEDAIKYYNQYLCSAGTDFKSDALCNLGKLAEEDNDLKKAEKYYLKAYEFDNSKNNYDGIYCSSMHLANLYFQTNIQKSFKYIQYAINSAEMLNDSFYIAQSHLLAGDYFYRINDNENALKEYIKVYVNVKDDFSKENLKKITDRIRDMELRLGVEKYSEIMRNYG